MKRFLYEYFPAWLLLVVFTFIVIHAPLTVFIGSHWPALALPIKAWKEVFIAIAGILIAIRMWQKGQWNVLRYDLLGWVILAYWGLHIAALAWTGASLQTVVAGLLIDLRYIVFAACVYHFLLLYPKYAKSFIRVGVVGAVIVVGFACLQLVLPHDALKYLGYSDTTIAPYLTVDKNPDYVRLNSTLRGPNPLGAYAVMALAIVASFAISKRHNLRSRRVKIGIGALIVASCIALWMSYSRSAVVAGLLALGIIGSVRYGRNLSRRMWVGLGVGTLVLAALAVAVWNTTFVQNVVLHDNPTTGAAVDSNGDHLTSLQHGVSKALSQPLGAGVGSTGSASLLGDSPLIIENQYLMIAHEVGWLGLALFMLIYVIFLIRIWHERQDWLALGVWASGIGLGLIGLLLPVWADDTVSIVWWGLAAMVLANEERRYHHGTATDKEAA